MKTRLFISLFVSTLPLVLHAQTSITGATAIGKTAPAPAYGVISGGLDSGNNVRGLNVDTSGHLLNLKPPIQASAASTVTSASNAAVSFVSASPATGKAWVLSEVQCTTGGGTIATLADGTQTLTSDNTNVSDGETVTIDTKVYTYKTALTPTEGQVLIGGSADASLLNLIRAINHSGTPGTDYQVAVAHPTVTAATSVTTHTFAITSKIPGSQVNAIATTETSAHLSWGAATLASGAGICLQVLDGTTIVKNLTIAAIGQEKFVFDPPIRMTAANTFSVLAGAGGSGVITTVNVDAYQQ